MSPAQNHDKITVAKAQLILGFPFFAHLVLSHRFEETPAIETLSTDGTTIRFNSQWVQKQPLDAVVASLAHEGLHTGLGHHAEIADRDLKRWNKACDYAINPLLKEAGLTLPIGALIDPEYKGLAAEQIYDRLRDEEPDQDKSYDKNQPPQNQQSRGDPGAKDIGGTGNFTPAITTDGLEAKGTDLENARSDANLLLNQAAMSARLQGDLPEGLQRAIADAKAPRSNIRRVLRRFVTSHEQRDLSWQRVDRRFVAEETYLPARHTKRIDTLVAVQDTSGSICQTSLDRAAAELTLINKQTRPKRLIIIYADARIQDIETFSPDETIRLKPKGGGGTNFEPAFNWIRDQRIRPDCLIYFTDLKGRFPQWRPRYPVLWITETIDKAPFGKTIRVRP